MKLKFENQAYQLKAVNNTVSLFSGMKTLDMTTILENQTNLLSCDVVSNGLQLDEDLLLKNLQSIQLNDCLDTYSTEIFYGDYAYAREGNIESYSDKLIKIPNFSIEMETGTGKTYVYLRSIFELSKNYGLSKFIIVVPSDAIRVGTLKSLDIMKDHFKAEYDNINYDYYQYDGDKIHKVRDFATTNTIQIMIMTIAAFNKSENNIFHPNDNKFGEYIPIELISAVKPVVIIDEPQSVDNTDNAKNAIKKLNPLFILRYSATHRNDYNQIYKLDAIDAYNQKLVKQIEVASIEDASSNNAISNIPYIKVMEVTPRLELILELDVEDSKGKVSRKIVKKVTTGTDLQEKTKNDKYHGFIVEGYSRDNGLKLANLDYDIAIGDSIGSDVDIKQYSEVMLRVVIENHIDKELRLSDHKIKVLSLFFIDKVSDYRIHSGNGYTDGKLAEIFIEQFKIVLKTPKGSRYIDLCKNQYGLDLANEHDLAKLHNGYFAKDKKGNFKDSKADTVDAIDAYNLIMRDKETLLSNVEPLRFIFSHSALKEGWDNPNVFQVCVLQDSTNQFKRRQQIGRGLRLCVNQAGERIHDEKINTLTVISSESYNSFANNLQKEYEDDVAIRFGIINKLTFVNKLMSDEPSLLLEDARKISLDIYDLLIASKLVDKDNKISDKCRKALKAGIFELESPTVKRYEKIVIDILNKLIAKMPIHNQRKKEPIEVNTKVYQNPLFKQLWKKISTKTIYSVNFETNDLIKNAVSAINNVEGGLEVKANSASIIRARVNFDEAGIDTELMAQSEIILLNDTKFDFVGKIVSKTGLTRKTVIKILRSISSIKLDMHEVNLFAFIEGVSNIINAQKSQLIIDGIKYTKLTDLPLSDSLIDIEDHYLQTEIKDSIDHGYLDDTGETNLFDAKSLSVSPELLANKFLYNVFRSDSHVETQFLKDCLINDKVKVVSKLPKWFKINTPLGKYNPDWALLVEENSKDELYFIVETKSSNFQENGHKSEFMKVKCGEKHFNSVSDIKYKIASSLNQVI